MNKINIASPKMLLQACPRCRGDMLRDLQDEEFVCLQCSRRFAYAQVAQHTEPQHEVVLAAAA